MEVDISNWFYRISNSLVLIGVVQCGNEKTEWHECAEREGVGEQPVIIMLRRIVKATSGEQNIRAIATTQYIIVVGFCLQTGTFSEQ